MAESPYRKPPPIKIAVLYTVSYGRSLERQGIAIREIESFESLVVEDLAAKLELNEAESKVRPSWISDCGVGFHIDQIIQLP